MRVRKKTGSCGAALAVACLVLPAVASAGDVEFYATADRDVVALDDTLTVTVTLGIDASSTDGELKLPDPDPTGFEVVSRRESQQMSFAMGQGGPPTFRKVRLITLLLQPLRTGTFTVNAGRLIFRGKTYETGTLRIQVVAAAGSRRPRAKAPPRPSSPLTPFGGLGGLLGGDDDPDAQDLLQQFFGTSRTASDTDLYVRTYADKKRAFLGEQITFSTYLFSRVDISGVEGFKAPKLDGFWAEDIETPQQITGELKTIDGVPYRVFLLRKRALFPIKSGKITIEPVEVDVATGIGIVLSGRKVHRTSKPLTVEVLPLPPGAPPGFVTPNVGQWHLSAEAAPAATQLGTPITLKVTVEGTGNLHDVVAPKLPPIAGFKVFDPTINEKVSTAKARFGGRRVLEYLLMPEQTGSFEVPALSLVYFDPAQKQYLTTTTQPLALSVETGTGAAPPVQAGSQPAPPNPEHANVLDASGLHPLRYNAELSRPALPVYRRPFFLPVAAAPCVLWLGLVALGLVRSTLRPSAGGEQRGRAARARKRLRGARALLEAHHPDAFYAAVSGALGDHLAARLGSPVAGLTRPELSARLAAAGADSKTVALLCATLDTCDAGRFAPGGSTSEAMERALGEAESVMEALDRSRWIVPPPQEVKP